MKETVELSPSGEEEKGINKDSDGAHGHDVSQKENGFAYVPIDVKLLRTIQRFIDLLRKVHNEEWSLVERIHYELLMSLESSAEFNLLLDRGQFDFDKWFPDDIIFERLPPIDLGDGPMLNLKLTRADINNIKETHKKWDREDKELSERMAKPVEPKVITRVLYPKVLKNGKPPTKKQIAEVDELLQKLTDEVCKILEWH